MTEQPPPYNGPEDTNILPPYGAPQQQIPFDQPAYVGPEPAPSARPPRSRPRTAAFLTAALLLGAGGGVAGAAAYEATNDDPAVVASSGSGTTGAVAPLTTDSSNGDPAAATGSAEAVAKSVLPSVVKITVINANGSGGSGSGIVLSDTGEILTNNHVAEVAGGNGKITVSFNDGSTTDATVVGTDPVTDLAVIQAQDVSGLTPARIGNSAALDVGQPVVAIGSPFGLEATVTSGIVSSLNRPVAIGAENGGGDDTIYPAIQTDAAINPGNSGGPLVNLSGQVVGVNSSIRTASSGIGGEGGSIGLGFAIPISNVLPVVEQLRNGETPTHARLGVTVSNKIEDGLATGAGIESVESGSAGDAAGLKSGDVVLKVDDEVISSVDSLVATIRGYRPGDGVTLTVLRDGRTMTIHATLDSDLATSQS